MRTDDFNHTGMWSYISPEKRVPQDHPLRKIRPIIDAALRELSPRFSKLYSRLGRPSIPPEQLLRALMLQMLYSVRSERQLMEQLNYNMLFRWFVGLDSDSPVWHPTTFTKNRDRFLRGDIADRFFACITVIAQDNELISDEHFTVDGTLIEAWASQKSFRAKSEGKSKNDPPSGGSNAAVNFRGEKRSNATHASVTDPDARLYKKSTRGEAKLGYLGHVLMENRHGFIVRTRLTHATGKAEREAALAMLDTLGTTRRKTLGADKGYDTHDFAAALRERNITPHIAANTERWGGSALDERTLRHESYAISQRKRKLVEEIFGWKKTVALVRKVRHRGLKLVDHIFTLASAAYNLLRIAKLLASPG